ncbi:hypothetical protein D3C73_1391050 [compost metagenome]
MTRSVRDVDNLIRIGPAIGSRSQFVQQPAKPADQIQIGHFVPAAYVVGRAGCTGVKHPADGVAMIGDVEPVAPLQAVAVDRQGLASESMVNDQRNQLFRELPRTVVI